MSPLPRLKVCGLTRAADVRLALDQGADALGFVHHPPSPRHVAAAELAALVDAAEGRAPTVLVTVAGDAKALAELAEACALDWVQLCGHQTPEDFAGFPRPLLRRLGVAPGAEAELLAWRHVAAGFVLDHPASPGGSGLPVELALAARLAAQAPCLLAGGLDGDNLGERVAAVRPHGIDAASRLEAAPGAKDPARVTHYLEQGRAALAALGDPA